MLNPAMILLLIATFAAVNLILGGVLMLRRGMSKRVAQRLEMTVSRGDSLEGGSLRRKSFGRDGAPWLMGAFSTSPLQRLNRLVTMSGIGFTTQQICAIMAGLSVAIALVVFLFAGLPLVLCVPIGIILGVAVPLFLVRRARNSRFAKIAAQLPDAVDLLARSLKAGHPVPTGISMIAHEMADPIGTEFRMVHEEMTYGLDLKDALAKMGERVGIPEVNYMIVAMRIQAGTGGSLAEILNSLGSVMRARQNLFAKVKALSAESRFAGKILGGMPVAVVGVLLIMNPHYYDDAKTSFGLQVTLGIAAFMSVIGVLLMRKAINIRV